MSRDPPPHSVALSRLRNIGIIAHIDAGKTTLTERILYTTGRTHKLGSVDSGTTVTDWMDQERERGITIVSAAVSAEWRDHRLNLIDTPGHIDFTAEVQRSLRVLDGGVVVFDGVQGVEPQSETVWHQADRYRVPRLCFINKMDRLGADFAHALETIRSRLQAQAVALQIPIGSASDFTGVVDLLTLQAWQWEGEGVPLAVSIPPLYQAAAHKARAELLEQLAEVDDEWLAQWLEGQQPTLAQLQGALRRATLAGRLFPVYCGAALRNRGIQPLLDGIVDFLPSPLDVGPATALDLHHNPVTCPPDSQAALAALVFKIQGDSHAGHLYYLRVYAGQLRVGDTVLNPRQDRKERIGRLVRLYGDRREDVETIGAGDIGAAIGLKGIATGDTLCALGHPLQLETIPFPEPAIQMAVEPRTATDQARLGEALSHLTEEDPTFRVSYDENTGQTLIAGMGELHLEVLLDRLKREQGIKVRVGAPRVTYKETITRPVARAEGRHFHHPSGSHGQYGHVVLALAPGKRGSGIVFQTNIPPGIIPVSYFPAIAKGVREGLENGILGGYPVTDVAVQLIDSSWHDKDSQELAYQVAAALALRNGLEQGGSTLLEPICRVEVTIPEEYLGEVMGQLAARHCEINQLEPGPAGTRLVRGTAPLAGMFGYATHLRSVSQGRGSFSLELSHYAPVSPRKF